MRRIPARLRAKHPFLMPTIALLVAPARQRLRGQARQTVMTDGMAGTESRAVEDNGARIRAEEAARMAHAFLINSATIRFRRLRGKLLNHR